MREEAVVVPIVAAIGMFFIVYFGERAFKSVVVEVLAGLGMKSRSEKIDSPLTTRGGDPLRPIRRKKIRPWRGLHHGRKPWN